MIPVRSMLLLAALSPLLTSIDACGDEPPDEPPEPADRFLLGVNYPWLNYGHDFGTTAWGHDGVSSSSSTAAVNADFAWLAGQGVHVVRWFVFGDGRAAPEFGADGAITGLDPYVIDDLDVALSMARAYDLYLIPVLLDFYWFDSAQVVSGVQLGGHSDVVSDPVKRRGFIDLALNPLLERYGSDPNILAWEVINEPEWAMDRNGAGWIGDPVSAATMQTFVEEVSAAIHAGSIHDVTVGSADRAWMLEHWAGLDLDLLQYHYYDDAPFQDRYDELEVALPTVIGEFPTAEAAAPVDGYLDAIYAGGFQGALAWSLNGEDGSSDFVGQADAFADWSAAHSEVVELP